MSELKPCPFCGSHDIKLDFSYGHYSAQCQGCSGMISVPEWKESAAIEIWNNRVEPENMNSKDKDE